MRRMRGVALTTAVAMVAVTGCTGMRRDPNCKWGIPLISAGLGATGGGLGVSQIENDPDDGEIAAGAAAGLVAGGIVGFLLGHYLCEEEAPPPPPAPAPPPPAARKKLETLTGPHFDFDKAQLKPEGKAKVDRAIRTVQENPSMRVSVEGHTDSVGSDAYNQRLSQRRAGTVRDYMVDKGIGPSRITTEGFGESKPVASNTTAEGRAENRRVEIIGE